MYVVPHEPTKETQVPEAEQSAGGHPPRASDAGLQPGAYADVQFSLMEGVLNELEVSGGMTTDEAEKADVARARLARLGGDAELYERLAGRGFAGVEYDFFRAELSAYALPVLRSFIRRKMIYSMCREVGRPVKPSDLVSDHLARHVDDRLELAGETIARGLQLFEQQALRGGKWTPQGGASLKTYFIGACVRSFSAAYKRWLAEYEHPDSVPLELAPEPCGVEDPEATAVGLLTVEEHLDAMKPVARDLAARVALRAETFEEAGEAFGLSARAVEGHFTGTAGNSNVARRVEVENEPTVLHRR